MKKRILALVLAVVMTMACLAGCGSTATETTTETTVAETTVEETTTEETTTEEETTAEPEFRTVVDSGGTEVQVPGHLETVFTFGSYGVINTLIETVGGGDLIKNNMSERFWTWEYQYKFAPNMDKDLLFDVNNEIDIEAVVAAQPDLCITMQEATAQSLREAGLTTLLIGYGNGRDYTSITDALDILAAAFGTEDIAAKYTEWIEGMVKKIEDVTSSLDESEKKKVLYGNVTSYINPHILIEWVIPAAGAISCTADIHPEGSCEFTAEDVLNWNPDAIFMITDQSEELKADEQINSVNAIANDQMFVYPTVGHFIAGSSEAPLAVLFTTWLLYPDLYTEEELSADMYDFYDTFFNYQMSDEELHDIIHVNDKTEE